jgi:hypothetical protein
MIKTRLMTENEIRRAGIAALAQAMGPTGAIRFLRQFDKGHGDYTAERARLLGNPGIEEVIRGLDRFETQRGRRRTAGIRAKQTSRTR